MGGNMPALEDITRIVEEAVSGNGNGDEKIPEDLVNDAAALTFYLSCNHEILTEKEERELFELYRDAKANGLEGLAELYKDRIIKNHQRWVLFRALKYIGNEVPLIDLFQEGNLGLLISIDKYDYTRGSRFYVCATWWVHRGITRALHEQSSNVMLSSSTSVAFDKVRRVIDKYRRKNNEEPSVEYIAKKTGYKIETVDSVLRMMHNVPASLDTLLENSEDTTLLDFIEDTNTESPLDYVIENELKEDIAEALGSLTPKEKEVLKLRFGIPHGNSMTLEEVGHEIGLTRERVRQIESKALKNLHNHPEHSKRLMEYLY